MKAYYYTGDIDEIDTIIRNKVLQPNRQYVPDDIRAVAPVWPALVIATADTDYTKYVPGDYCVAIEVDVDNIANKLIPPHPGFIQMLEMWRKHGIDLSKLYWTPQWVKVKSIKEVNNVQ